MLKPSQLRCPPHRQIPKPRQSHRHTVHHAPMIVYHVEAQSSLSLCIEHNQVHDTHCHPYELHQPTRSTTSVCEPCPPLPVNISLYHFTTSCSLTSFGGRSSSTMTPSESMTRYVGMAGYVAGRWKERSVVNLLLTAPGKCTLHNCEHCNTFIASGITH